ncbi:ATP-grasp domain-containing protein [Phosphitispora fastidiosa]|uniref:ATP-grasp domain-containing protein n=1 Tax=Phosphitispora fastidiosa TaxID=2837202 RepID=UPI001E3F6886|nr:ATP-grasp domain-containing protein [Phosphitispora fastidiosa]MBU7006384.1 carbamoyl-phosphate synthase large subunit [Phosphitispora fastidiosa]
MVNFLFTSVGRRVELIKYFCRWGKVISADISPLAPAAHFTDKHYQIPRFNDEQYIPSLLEICKREKISGLIPLLEPEFLVLAAHRDSFASVGTTLILSSDEALEICQDKYQTYRFFCSGGIKSPATYLPEEIPSKCRFPLFIKPRSGMGSTNTFRVNNKKELKFFLQYVPNPVIQEFIEGVEYTMDVLNDFTGKTIAVVPRERIEVRTGEVSKSRTVKDIELINLTVEVAEKLGGIGPLTIQAFKKAEGQVLFTEINPRFGGGVPLAIAAGVNYPQLLARMIQKEKLQPLKHTFKDGLYILRYDEALFLDEDNLSQITRKDLVKEQ